MLFGNGKVAKSISVVAFNEQRDLAIIRVPQSDSPTVELGDSADVQIGEPVLLMGSPKGLAGSVTTGVVSAVRNSPLGFQLIQTDAASNPGSSGGPLINSKGEVIAVLNSKLANAENVSFAVPIDYVIELLDAARQPMSLAEMRRRLGNRPASVRIKTSIKAEALEVTNQWKQIQYSYLRRLHLCRGCLTRRSKTSRG